MKQPEILDLLDDLIIITDENNIIKECNNAFAKFFNCEKSSIIGKNESEFFIVEHKKQATSYDESLYLENKIYFFETKIEPLDEENKNSFLVIRKDISDSKNLFNLYNDDKKILSQIASGKSLEDILDNIIEFAQKLNKDMKCSIFLLNENRLHAISGPSIPEFYTKAVSGMRIGEKVGSCGAAAFLKQRVVVEDILNHENWCRVKDLILQTDFRSCWSQPIFSSKGEVLGTFAMYYSTPKKPTDIDLYIIEDRANLAGIAIERHYNEKRLKENLENEKQQEKILMHQSKQAMMGEMLENIAHQWRQPLSIIATSSTGMIIKKEMGLHDENEELAMLKNINENAQYLSGTIDDFRNYITRENISRNFNIRDVFEKTFSLITTPFKRNSIELIKNIEDIELNGLDSELTQVFLNIFNNTLDAFEDVDKDKRYIFINAYKEDESLVIKILDSANGTCEDVIDRIFEPYFTTKENTGTGIGLYMCKDIIEKQMNGTLLAKNLNYKHDTQSLKGLEFTIVLPL